MRSKLSPLRFPLPWRMRGLELLPRRGSRKLDFSRPRPKTPSVGWAARERREEPTIFIATGAAFRFAPALKK
eukprot:2058076-Pyramimonas_sp.AAC.1